MTGLSRLLLTALFFLFISACKEAAPPPRAEVARPAKIFTVEAPGSNYLRSFPGEVQATDTADLAFRVGGELEDFPATRGLRVDQGDLLARIDDADYQEELATAQAQFDLSKTQFERSEALVERQLVSQADYDQKLAIMKVRQSSLAKARNNVDYTKIYAPFDGVVARRMAENFESVTAGQVVLVLQTGEMVDVIVDVPESIVARVERTPANQNPRPVSVRFDSVSDQVFEASYKEHETQTDSATLTFKVTFSLPAPEGINILPGMTATMTADLSGLFGGESEGHLVPIEAVFAAEDEALESETRYVWKVDSETMRASRQGVRIGSMTGNNIVVLEGIESGDMIVSAGVNSVLENMLLREMSREAGL
jgi:RND family efflux transporter MFP subunit